MAIYSEKVDQVLKIYEGAINPLLKYDNYTYHIQFFLVDKQTQINYSRARFDNFEYGLSDAIDATNECCRYANTFLDGHKFIIAESGKSNDISIVSLDIKSIPGFGTRDNTFAASEEFKLKIKEAAGNGLVNKIYLTTSLLGYKSYVNTPFFLSIWFTGYNNTNKEIVEYPIKDSFAKDLSVLTFQVIIDNVNTNCGEHETIYDMTLRPITDIGMIQSFASVNKFKSQDIKKGEPIGSIFKKIEDAKNKELRDAYSDGLYEAIYGIEKPAFQIKTTDVMPNFKDIDELFKLENIDSKEQTDSQKSYKIVRERLTLGEERAKYQSSVDRLTAEAEKLKSQGRTSAANARYDMATHYKGSIETIDRAIASGKVTKDSLGNMVNEKVVYTNNESEVSKQYDFGVWPMANCPFEPSTGNNITSVLTEVFQICCPKTDYLPTYNFVPEYVRDYKGVAYYRMTLYVSYNQVPGLYESIRNKDEKELLNYALYGPHTIEEAQLRYLKTIIDQGALLKKYRWLLNGVEESVLSYDMTNDALWFLNAGDYASRLAKESSQSINRDKIVTDFKNSDIKCELLMDLINSKIGANKDGRHIDININDISNMVDAKTAELMDSTFIRGAEANDLFVDYQRSISMDKTEKESNKDDDERLKVNANIQDSKIGAQNMLSHGQKTELKMKIIGDPYWLTFMSENIQIPQRALPHIIMDIKTYSKLDSWDEPREDEMMRLITVYRITDIDSHFEEGKFTQDLHGFIATPFAHGYNPTFYKKIATIENMGMSMLETGTVLIDNFGNTHILKGTTEEMDVSNPLSKEKKDYMDRKNSQMSSSDSKLVITKDDGTKFTVDRYDDIASHEFMKDEKY